MYQVCNDYHEICHDIDTEGWCKHQRSDLIIRRYQQLQTPRDLDNTYRTLMSWRKFNDCIAVASKITRRTVEDRTSVRTKAYLTSIKEIEKLEQQTLASTYPQLMYYHWAEDGKQYRIDALIKLDQQGKMASTELQLMMASYYAKVDKTKEMTAQYNALSLLDLASEYQLNNQIYASLATNYYQKNKYHLAFIWARVAEKSGLKTAAVSTLKRKLKAEKYDLKHLEDIAHKTYLSIAANKFTPPEQLL